MLTKKRACIIGGGVAGVGLLSSLAQDDGAADEWEVTLVHDGASLGGDALTVPVDHNGKTFPVDTGIALEDQTTT